MSAGVGPATAALRAFKNSVKRTEVRQHIQLRNLPRNVTQSDIRRMLRHHQVSNVLDVALEYRFFQPAGHALLTFSDPNNMQNALTRLQGVSISSVPIAALPSTPSVDVVPSRTRDITRPPSGLALEGNGPRAGISGEGRTVLIQGLKPSMTEKNMRNLLVPFKLAGTNDLWKAQTRDRGQASSSRFVVQLATEAEAHRLVRTLHLTTLKEQYGPSKPTTVRVKLIH